MMSMSCQCHNKFHLKIVIIGNKSYFLLSCRCNMCCIGASLCGHPYCLSDLCWLVLHCTGNLGCPPCGGNVSGPVGGAEGCVLGGFFLGFWPALQFFLQCLNPHSGNSDPPVCHILAAHTPTLRICLVFLALYSSSHFCVAFSPSVISLPLLFLEAKDLVNHFVFCVGKRLASSFMRTALQNDSIPSSFRLPTNILITCA